MILSCILVSDAMIGYPELIYSLDICENHKDHKKSAFHPAGNMRINANAIHAEMKSEITFEQVNGTQIGYDCYEKAMISAMNFFVFRMDLPLSCLQRIYWLNFLRIYLVVISAQNQHNRKWVVLVADRRRFWIRSLLQK
ncbi:MAG: hypothetical protein ACHQEM_11345 [Chitinophagales bacterium]